MSQLHAMLLTLAIETPLVVICMHRHNFIFDLIFAAIPSLLTHPVLWYLTLHELQFLSYITRVSVLELAVVFIEAMIIGILFKRKFIFCLGISFMANSMSALIGICFWRYL